MRDIEKHCVALMIKKIINCDDAKAVEAADMIDRYYEHPAHSDALREALDNIQMHILSNRGLEASRLVKELQRTLTAPSGATEGCEPPNWCEAEMMRLIDLLRSEEGDSVTILCDNPDPRTEAENNAVVCNGFWTDFKDRRFQGVGLLDALSAAMIEYKRPKTSDGGNATAPGPSDHIPDRADIIWFNDVLAKLTKWREADHEDNITLSRHEVCTIVDQFSLLRGERK